MKAIVCEKYGPCSDLKLKNVAKPTPKENEVLVKVHASAINDYDWSMARGKPFIYRLIFGFSKPKNPILGMELAGTIEGLGEKATQFSIGDKVYGDISDYGFGSFSEYICVNENALTSKPDTMSFEDAASISHAANLATQGLIDLGKIKAGQKVLINGAGGGVGSFGLQIAKLYNAEVTGVDTGKKLEEMNALGFDHIIDYKKQNFTKNGIKYDLILDAKTTHGPFAYPRSLKTGGSYISIGGQLSKILQLVLLRPLIKLLKKKNVQMLALKTNKDLDYINDLYKEGKIKCVIDGPYPLNETPLRIQYFGDGLHTGKVIINISH